MSDFTLVHNPRCATSRAALGALVEAVPHGTPIEVIPYLKDPLTRDEVLDLLSVLDDEPTALVRRDATFKKLALSDGDVATAEQVADVLAAHPELMQRPVVRFRDRAIIGRPKDRVPAFLAAIDMASVNESDAS